MIPSSLNIKVYTCIWSYNQKYHKVSYYFLYTVRIKKKVIHIQRPIVLKSINLKIYMWHISKEQLINFPLVPFLHQVCHAWRVHCHWRWQCHDPLFASFDNWIKASLPNSVMAWLLKLSHLMPGDHFLSGKFWITRCLHFSLCSWGSFSVFDMN